MENKNENKSQAKEALKRSGEKIIADTERDISQLASSGIFKNPFVIVLAILALGYAMRDVSSLIQAALIGVGIIVIRSFFRKGGVRDLFTITGSVVSGAADAASVATKKAIELKNKRQAQQTEQKTQADKAQVEKEQTAVVVPTEVKKEE